MIELTNAPPDPAAFIALRAACGWGTVTYLTAQNAIQASLTHATLMHGDDLIAMGRVVGDGALYFFLQDIVVHPDHRGSGYGRAIVDRLMADIAPLAKSGSTIGLMAAKGVEGMYEDAGFTARPTDAYGPGMTLFP